MLCSRQITMEEIERADSLLLEFCKKFEDLYGKQHYTINLHLHAHLKDCILDYGPISAFWLFPLERLNGILGAYHTNCHDITLQLMGRFTSSLYNGTHNWPDKH